jgi:tungstate transport system substrate-binding protein
MYNDFVLIGPKSDPAGIRGMTDVAQALGAIRDSQATFISRGDHSGTHLAEVALWEKGASINIQKMGGAWYRPVALGMKATLNVARATDGYVLSDRGTWLSSRDKGNLQILVEGDRRLFNQYSVILVNLDSHPRVKKELGQRFIDWLTSPEGQQAIADYKINGEHLFFPNARDPDA